MADVHTQTPAIKHTRSRLLHAAASPLGSLTPAEAPLIEAIKTVQTTGSSFERLKLHADRFVS